MSAVVVVKLTTTIWVPKSTLSGNVLDTKARLAFVAPAPAEVVHGSNLHIRLRLTGGRLVALTSTKVRPDAGHIHLTVDGKLVSMVNGLSEDLTGVPAGEHAIKAEFVAANPRSCRH